MSELNPCPFCGRKAALYVCDGSGEYHTKDLETATLRGRKMTHCQFRCKCGIMTKPYLTRRGLRNAWNRRANDEKGNNS